MEVDGIGKYRRQAAEWPQASAVFSEILPEEIVHEIEIFREMRRDTQRGVLRSAILGANDGLGSILALSAGVAAATSSSRAVLIAGVSGLVAGAASMAASGYVSVKAEREVLETRAGLEREAADLAPAVKQRQLVRSFIQRGLEPAEAERAAERLSREPGALLRAILNDQGLADESGFEQPLALSIYTGGAFLLAGAIPLIPFLFAGAGRAVVVSIVLSAAALYLAGLLRSLATLKSFARSGLEMVLVGLGSAGLTYVVGWLVGGGAAG
jgi:vacuolar iron transporter family protein